VISLVNPDDDLPSKVTIYPVNIIGGFYLQSGYQNICIQQAGYMVISVLIIL